MIAVPSDKSADVLTFHTQIAPEFSNSYKADPNRLERVEVWNRYIARYAKPDQFAYDLGCGPAVLTCELASKVREVIAIDGSEGMLQVARKTASERRLSNITFQQRRLPFSDPTLPAADFIISSSVLEYLESFDDGLRLLSTLLKDDAIAIFSMSNRSSLSRLLVRGIHKITGHPRYLTFLHHFVTEDQVASMLRRHDMECLASEFFAGQDSLNRLFGKVLPAKYSSNMIIFVARRLPR